MRCCIILLALATLPNTTLAQTRLEIGVDGGVLVGANGTDIDITTIAFPVSSLRIGFHIADRFSIEPALSFTHVDPEGDANATDFELSLSVLYHFSANPSRPRLHFLAGIVNLTPSART